MKDDLVILSIIKELYLELVMDYNALSLNVAAKKMFQKLKKKWVKLISASRTEDLHYQHHVKVGAQD